jgi:hypothetical protein
MGDALPGQTRSILVIAFFVADPPSARRHETLTHETTTLRSTPACRVVVLIVAIGCLPAPAWGVLDIGDRGPILDAGAFRMRVTNAGIVGNAFFSTGRSFDPSFEYPAYSGHEMLNYGALWVGARSARGEARVSGGPLLEWRPTIDPGDDVREARRGRLGSLWLVDDDGDGKVDEEILNGLDDDHDGQIDEDLGLTADQLLAADYVDDRPEAVNFTSTGEPHVPLHLSVHQEAMAWGRPGYDRVAALRFQVTNHGSETLSDVYLGFLADLDSKDREDISGHLDDRIERHTFAASINEGIGINVITFANGDTIPACPGNKPAPPAPCIFNVRNDAFVLSDGAPDARQRISVMGLSHTTDPLARIPPVARYARAPAVVSFRNMVFSNDRPAGQGGLPTTDATRYSALAGQFPEAVTQDRLEDFAVLVSCGPFDRLAPGESLEFEVALVAAPDADSLQASGDEAVRHHYGVHLDLEPDITGRDSTAWYSGRSGLNGHDACIAAPPGMTFQWDPHCFNATKFGCELSAPLVTYTPDSCIWTDTDCDPCTGFGGRETAVHWPDPGATPPAPRVRVTPGDHEVTIEWDNGPEVLLAGGQYGTPLSTFLGYRLYRIDDWSRRNALLPPREDWSIRRIFSDDSLDGATPLASVIDSSVDYERILFEQKLYPPGHYRFRDTTPLNGFDYVYVLTSVYDLKLRQPNGNFLVLTLESPLSVSFDQRVAPRSEARAAGNEVWVVPNPFRASAPWERPPVSGDVRTRHVDFMGMPKSRATIKIWTVAGDLVAILPHDGTNGAGEASWDLVSRKGQEVESGIYLFTVESPLGMQRGKFVVIR